jgi:phenylacetate-CoA ligase
VQDNLDRFRSSLAGLVWPALPGAEGQLLLALQFQLDQTQWWSAAELERHQLLQLDALARHAHATVPYYRERWQGLYDPARPLTREDLARLPLLTRTGLQDHFELLKSVRIPPEHGVVAEQRTSGSTGSPVKFMKTGLNGLFWMALTLREHLWHRRDLGGKLAAIRQGVTEGETDGWGPATDLVAVTGRSAAVSPRVDVDSQLEWIEQQQPDYLLCYPSSLLEMLRHGGARRFPRLKEVRTIGETVATELRALCREAWHVPLTDLYSSQEVGQIALQCPECDHYHVQSEMLLVEILDEQGRSCGPGEVGRVVVSSPHSFAMPLVRYEIGDYAEVGPPCRCGRGLPVLTRILGRVRNTLVLANGARYWPTFGNRAMTDVAPVRQFQFVQKSYERIEARLVTERPLTTDEEGGLRELVQSRLPARFEISFDYCSQIPRSAGGKYEDFLSEVAQLPDR